MHEQSILDDLLGRLNIEECTTIYKFSLVCSEEALVSRINKDIENGIRDESVIERTVSRLKNYYDMDTVKIDVSKISSEKAAEIIYTYITKQKLK